MAFEGGLDDLYRANLHLRTASRVLVRLGDFYAAAFPELRKKASRLPWDELPAPGPAGGAARHLPQIQAVPFRRRWPSGWPGRLATGWADRADW